MDIEGRVVLITGANRGIGRAMVASFLKAGAARVYAAARDPASLAPVVKTDPRRIVPVTLDIVSDAQVAAAAVHCADTDILVNNAGIMHYGGFTGPNADLDRARAQFEVNFWGTWKMARAFAPVLRQSAKRKGDAAMANICSIVSWVSSPGAGAYSASKAAEWSLSQALRPELFKDRVFVHTIFPGVTDTDMTTNFPVPIAKAPPEHVARATIMAIREGREDVFVCPNSVETHAAFGRDPKAVEKAYAARARKR